MIRRQAIRRQVLGWSILIIILSTLLLGYLLTSVSPYLFDNQLNIPAIILLFASLLLFTQSLATLIALRLHTRWPALAGEPTRYPDPIVAVRQGLLVALATIAIALLALFHFLDIIFVLVILLLAGLIEVFIQNRQRMGTTKK